MNVDERLEKLRKSMRKAKVQAYLVPSSDPHQSEYPPDFWKRRQYISGFTGSAGDLAVTLDKAGLWTDGRYFEQAETQLEGSGIDLFKMGRPNVPKMEKWLADRLSGGGALGVDPEVVSMESCSKLRKALKKKGARVELLDRNLVDEIWDDRPPAPSGAVRILPDASAGKPVGEKLDDIRKKMESEGCSLHLLCALDAIAWTFNLRGKDIAFSPVFVSYAAIGAQKAHLFVAPGKIDDAARAHLRDLAEVRPYEDIWTFLEKRGREGYKVWLDPKTTNKRLEVCLGEAKTHEQRSPVSDLKSAKNETELEGFRKCLVEDGVAMVRFLKWLEEAVPRGGVTESGAAERLASLRSEGEGFAGLSFETIAAYGKHGAIVHYAPTPESDARLAPEGLFLLDSGGQYLTGTTDITRTVALGEPTEEQKEMFTRVLKGHIGIATLRFPQGFSGRQLELAARRPLWEVGKNYEHGTGHGVGHYLNVHEGPVAISPKEIGVPLRPGNVLSNEPGYYKKGEYGIRIENLTVVEKDEKLSSEDSVFLRFETLTLCPLDLSLVDKELMSGEEIEWLDAYHEKVREQLSGRLDDEHRRWLEEKTRSI